MSMNRYTRTTLTKRQIESLTTANRKLRKIYYDRKDMPQEAKEPIELIAQAIILLDRADLIIQDEREFIRDGVQR